jgi:hypothetical protein
MAMNDRNTAEGSKKPSPLPTHPQPARSEDQLPTHRVNTATKAARLRLAARLAGAPPPKSVERAAKAFENFRLSRFASDAPPANYVDRLKRKDPAAVQALQRTRITQQLEKLPEAHTQNPGLTLSFPVDELGETQKSLPGLRDNGGEIELGALLKYIRGRMNGTDLSPPGNSAMRRLTAETQFRSQARAIIERIKSRTGTAQAMAPEAVTASKTATQEGSLLRRTETES